MKQLKKGIALLLTLSTVFALSVSASATEFTLVKSNSKSANVGTVNSGPTATYARTFSHGITDF